MDINNVYSIRSQITSQSVIDILRQYFEERYSADEVDEALKNISIEVSRCSGGSSNSSGDKTIVVNGGGKPKDYTKYKFEGGLYTKSWLPHAVVNAYVRDNPDVSCQMLKTVFPSSIQGSLNVVATPNEGSKYDLPGKRYHVVKPIILRDHTAVWVCSQWGANLNIERFIKKAENLGYNIIPLKKSI